MRVLVLTRYFPPSNEVGGFRAEAFWKYLPSQGIDTYVFTETQGESLDNVFRFGLFQPKNQGGKAELLDFSLSKRLKKALLYKHLRECILKIKPDALLVTAPPFYLFKLTSLVSKELNIPWIADYRDAWTNNVSYLAHHRGRLKHILNVALEKYYLSSASLITTASPVYKHEIRKVISKGQIEVVYNGFFEEDFQDLPHSPISNDLDIAYLGTLYPFHNVELFLEGLRDFSASFEFNITCDFLGILHQPGATNRVESFDATLLQSLNLTNKLPRREALLIAQKSNVMLLFCNENVPQLYAKVFDYIALQKPILVVGKEEFMVNFLKGISNVMFCETKEEVVLALTSISELKPSNHLKLKDNPELMKYSRYSHTIRMAKIIKEKFQ
jgi:glycosyltransferase involved in cell wall biosynthesis